MEPTTWRHGGISIGFYPFDWIFDFQNDWDGWKCIRLFVGPFRFGFEV